MKNNYDVVIVGGGLVGATLGVALKKSRYSVAILEATQPKKTAIQDPLDNRAIVLSKASFNILKTLSLWEPIKQFATPIANIHVSKKNHLGTVRLSAKKHEQDAFGYVVIAQHLYQCLQDSLDGVDVFYGAKFKSMTHCATDQSAELVCDYEGEKKISTNLVVAADGVSSAVRKKQNVKTVRHDYHQSVVICNVELQRSHLSCAYERFAEEGPCALLPMSEKMCAVVWATNHERAKQLTQLSEKDFLEQLQSHFGYRLGKFVRVNKPFCFPLSLVHAPTVIAQNLVLVGNAAQSVHPVAGQGLNLGLRDVATLAQVLDNNKKPNLNFSLLEEYEQWRQYDRRHILNLTHSLVTLFSNDLALLNYGTSAGLMLLDRLPKMKKLFAEASMGFVGNLPKLACGVAL